MSARESSQGRVLMVVDEGVGRVRRNSGAIWRCHVKASTYTPNRYAFSVPLI